MEITQEIMDEQMKALEEREITDEVKKLMLGYGESALSKLFY